MITSSIPRPADEYPYMQHGIDTETDCTYAAEIDIARRVDPYREHARQPDRCTTAPRSHVTHGEQALFDRALAEYDSKYRRRGDLEYFRQACARWVYRTHAKSPEIPLADLVNTYMLSRARSERFDWWCRDVVKRMGVICVDQSVREYLWEASKANLNVIDLLTEMHMRYDVVHASLQLRAKPKGRAYVRKYVEARY